MTQPRGSTETTRPKPSLPPQVEAVVIGGGIAGCATAYHLARAGVEVAILDEFDLNTMASGRNAGSLHGQIQHGPFAERGEDWARAFLPALQFLADSLELWQSLSSELGTDLEVVTNGGLLIAETESQLQMIRRKVELEQAAGLASEVLTASELHRMAPYISTSMIGAGFSAIEGKANPLLAAPAFAKAAVTEGAAVLTNTSVNRIARIGSGFEVETSRGTITSRHVVAAAGSGLRTLVSALGVDLPIHDEPIQLSATEPVSHFVDHLIYFAGGALTFKQARAGSVLIGGGWPAKVDPATKNVVVNPDSLRRNLAIAQRVVPRIGSLQVLRSWTGVARNTPDLLPVVGSINGVIVGMYPHMGFTAGPLLGRTLADLVLGHDRRDLAAFAPDRF